MSGGLPEAKPWANCCPRSEATTTLTGIPVRLVNALAALLTAYVSAGPELPMRAVSVFAFPLCWEPRAVPAVTASAATMTSMSTARERAMRVFECAFTTEFLLGAIESGVGIGRGTGRSAWGRSHPFSGWKRFQEHGRRDYAFFPVKVKHHP